MINLAPDELKTNTRYGVKNSRLLHLALAEILAIVAIAALVVVSVLSMSRSQKNLQSELNSQTQKLEALKPVEAQGQKFYDQIMTINELLNRQTKFSELLPMMASLLPSGAILDQLNFSAEDIRSTTATTKQKSTTKASAKPFVIKASVTDRPVAATLLENIRSRSDLFTGADLIDVTAVGDGSEDASGQSVSSLAQQYPYHVTINAYFKKQSATNSLAKVAP